MRPFNSAICLLILFNFTLAIVSSNDDGQWKKEDLPREEAMDEDEPLAPAPPTKNSDHRTKKSFDLNSTETNSKEQPIDEKKLDDLKKAFADSTTKDAGANDSRPTNETMGRSSANYGLDELVNPKDDKEGRIMNADDELVLEKPRMNIQGFIPVVGLAGAALGSAAVLNSAQKRQRDSHQRVYSSSDHSFVERFSSRPNYMPLGPSQFNPASLISQQNQYQATRFGQPPRSERRRFSSTLQNLASSLTGSVNKLTKRKQVVDYSSFAQECICVPFYMCRSGFIEQTAKNQPGAGQTFQMREYNQYRDQSFYEKQLHEAQAELNKYYSPNQIAELLAGLNQQERSPQAAVQTGGSSAGEQYQESQRNYATINSNSNSADSSSDLELPINERSIDGKQNTHFLDSANGVSSSH